MSGLQAGWLLLLRSHQSASFESAGARISIAFDVLPTG